MEFEFEWDANKAQSNLVKHGISFEEAQLAFFDPHALEFFDERENYGEERIILIGQVDDYLLTIVYTERNSVIRIISARESDKNEYDRYFLQNSQN